MKVLILGASGMLGSAVYKTLCCATGFEVWGTIRNAENRKFFPEGFRDRLYADVDVLGHDALLQIFELVRPDVVINCVGLIKQLEEANNPLVVLPINAMLPHRLAHLCAVAGARLVHISTDCVFSGRKGGYVESDLSDAEDLYGKSKFIGEVSSSPHVVTVRTSIIGHEIRSANALIEWFLSQKNKVKGFSKAIFSGLPTVELARVLVEFVLPRSDLNGLYHVSAQPISKYDLLKLVASQYDKEIEVEEDDSFVIDRSLNSEYFAQVSGYRAPDWVDLVASMHESADA